MKIENNCFEQFASIKRGNKNGIFYLNGETLDVLQVSDKKETPTWESFTCNLPMDKCCLLFTHFDYISATDSVERSKFVNVLCSRADATRKEKNDDELFHREGIDESGSIGNLQDTSWISG